MSSSRTLALPWTRVQKYAPLCTRRRGGEDWPVGANSAQVELTMTIFHIAGVVVVVAVAAAAAAARAAVMLLGRTTRDTATPADH